MIDDARSVMRLGENGGRNTHSSREKASTIFEGERCTMFFFFQTDVTEQPSLCMDGWM